MEQLLPDEAGETTLRHLSPTPLWDDNPVVKLLYIDNFAALALSQAEADESLTRMMGRLGAAGVVARVELPTGALVGFQLVESETCWRPTPKKFWCIALALRELAFGKCRRTGTRISRALGHATSLFGSRRELDSVFFEGRVGRVWALVRREYRIAWRCSYLQRLNKAVGYNCSCGRLVSFGNGSCGSHCIVNSGLECWFNLANACYLETT